MLLSLAVLSAVFLSVVYFQLVSKYSRGLASPYPKADIRRRLFAATVDASLLVTAAFLYRLFESPVYAVAGAAYLLLRDGMQGRSVGKFLFGLMVVSLETGRPCTYGAALRRNILLLMPGANVVAIFLETVTIVRDPLGQRLGDRVALTQVVDGLGVKDFAAAFQRWWVRALAEMGSHSRRPGREPVEVDP
jgi:uncharacterized RDD family membrane protein YckC